MLKIYYMHLLKVRREETHMMFLDTMFFLFLNTKQAKKTYTLITNE